MTQASNKPPLPRLPALLGRAERPWLAIPAAWLLALGGSLALATIAQLVFPAAAPPDFEGVEGAHGFFLLVVFAPLVETLIMAGVLAILLKFMKPLPAVILSAIGWGVAHSMAAPTWGLVIWWPFLIFSVQFVVWRQRGWGWALAVPALTHAMQNSLPAMVLLLGL
ncbi:CPBP family glutamic-type intramembrane protease [Sphingomicrobium lutaoense]|uniref:CAAX protease self-immunity n=1 Tax=Sphingomicrobium lutaoense TaxID=515949 RepID=A0A839YWJ9_9SPHN|nr:CPBP family glutamic-type intramembrane protease [Sphingomicrobium lutaoense]MBB3763569.1 hypothetical protein [Sphingomicrobium lutaoense]